MGRLICKSSESGKVLENYDDRNHLTEDKKGLSNEFSHHL